MIFLKYWYLQEWKPTSTSWIRKHYKWEKKERKKLNNVKMWHSLILPWAPFKTWNPLFQMTWDFTWNPFLFCPSHLCCHSPVCSCCAPTQHPGRCFHFLLADKSTRRCISLILTCYIAAVWENFFFSITDFKGYSMEWEGKAKASMDPLQYN